MRNIRTFSKDTELVAERRNHIVKIAAELIVKKGYNNISTRELATALGMSTGGLYHYIGSKADILYLIINFTAELTGQTLERMTDEFKGATPADQLKESIKVYFETVDYYRDFHNFVNHIMLSLSFRDRRIVYQAESRIIEFFESLLKSGMEKGDFRDADARIVAHNIVATANAWANRGWFLKKYYTLDQYTQEQVNLILGQITAHGR
ncbi:MAG: TetR/AcrR family transcriptional regulator [Candidatus Omnitrophica bacterium]|jgi:AcrR family transcriptional regulator|nr:TetR/AcrR family transcriptional regulator [Candidatus Omnitrophota bacterium]